MRFYTETGNWDVVALNMPTFPIRDPAQFDPLIESRSRNIQHPFVDPDKWWEFTAAHPESLMELVQLFSDYAFPDGWRYLDAASHDVVKFVNKNSEGFYVKFQVKSHQESGKHFTLDQLCQATLESEFHAINYAQQDLYRAIERGDFPKWTLYVQIMTMDQARNSPFNPFDPTKSWPISKYPLVSAGELTLNKNPVNIHEEIERAVFTPNNLIPGLEPSPDPIFQTRAKDYTEAHKLRLGEDYLNIPPNTMLGVPGGGHKNFSKNYTNPPDVEWCGQLPDEYAQPKEFYDGLNGGEQSRLAQNLANWLRKAKTENQEKVLGILTKVSEKLSKDVKTVMSHGM